MKPAKQTIEHDEQNIGNCLQACIASILEFPIEDVPHFVAVRRADWYDKMNDWLLENAGVYIMSIDSDSNMPAPHGYSIANGRTKRGTMHSVVLHNGVFVFDPHRDGVGLVSESSYHIFVSPMLSGR